MGPTRQEPKQKMVKLTAMEVGDDCIEWDGMGPVRKLVRSATSSVFCT